MAVGALRWGAEELLHIIDRPKGESSRSLTGSVRPRESGFVATD